VDPIELIWAKVKGYLATHNKIFGITDVEKFLQQAVDQIPTEKWENCARCVVEREEPRFWGH
jgi:hypothetical protein